MAAVAPTSVLAAGGVAGTHAANAPIFRGLLPLDLPGARDGGGSSSSSSRQETVPVKHAAPWEGAVRASAMIASSVAVGVGIAVARRMRPAARRAMSQRSAHCRVALRASSADQMQQLLEAELPGLMGQVSVRPSSEGDCLSLFAKKAFAEGDVIFRWPLDSDTVLVSKPELSDQLPSGDWGALAFQVLRATRSKQPVGPWADWIEAGANSPDTHPLKLLFSDVDLARRLWSSTTCGGRMSSAALQLRDDVEAIRGSATLQEWAEALALVQSRSIIEDDSGAPLLVFGLDLLQDGDVPNVEAQRKYTKAPGSSPFGFGSGGEQLMTDIELVATRDLKPGDELLTRYLPKPHGGKYLEQYGFIPTRLQGSFAKACAELAFAPTDEEDDPQYGPKQSLLEDRGLSTDPIPFLISTSEGIYPPKTEKNFDEMTDMDRMVFMLRLRNLGGKESFLLDAVYVSDAWNNCHFYISKDNESQMCKMVLEECDRWLERFRAAEDTFEAAEEGTLAAAADDIRRGEIDILERVRMIFQQELQETNLTETRRYWADRQMDNIFPERARRGGSIWDERLLD